MAPGVTERRDDLLATASLLRRGRAGAAVLVSVQFWLYQPPVGMEMPYPRALFAAAFVAILLLVNAVSLWATRTCDVRGLRRVAIVELTVDAGHIYALVLLFTFDPHSSLWALLIIPVLEGAARASLAGALWSWIGVSLGYLAREAWGAAAYEYRDFGLDGVTYVVGIIGIVALSMGLMARSLRRRTEAYRAAKAEAEQRAEQLDRAKGLLAHQAYHDDLTGLANRARFLDALAIALRPGSGVAGPVGVIFLDLDDLKSVNDDLGHAAGDELLERAADRLRRSVRDRDLVARHGGDEFTVLVMEADDAGEIALVADRIVEAFREPVRLTTGHVEVTASVGLAVGTPGRDTAERMLSTADTRMYSAKRSGGDRWHGMHTAVTTER